MKPLKSICILRLSSIGDVTHIVPIINTIKKNSVETSITWVIGSTEYELVKTMPNLNFIVMDKNNFLIEDVIEKPSIKEAPSNKAVIGRYILHL